MGKLYTSIIQEINNTLGSVTGCAEIIAGKLDTAVGFKKLSRMLTESATAAADLCRRLLKFLLSAQPGFEVLEIYRLLREVVNVLPPRQQEKIRIESMTAVGITVDTDRLALETVLLGIILNMQPVVDSAGLLLIRIDTADNTDSSLVVADYELAAKKYLKIVFSGESLENVAYLRSKFAKPDALLMHNTGMTDMSGLYGLVQHLQGALAVIAGAGREIRVEVYLPFQREELQGMRVIVMIFCWLVWFESAGDKEGGIVGG